jgi:uncharacterized membrane protein
MRTGRIDHRFISSVTQPLGSQPNDVIEEQASFGNRVADTVARFGGSLSFILSYFGFLTVYVCISVSLVHSAWDPYPFILLDLFLSMLAATCPSGGCFHFDRI